MELRDHFIRVGNRLFRWRSYVPLVVLGLVLFAVFAHRLHPDTDRAFFWLAAGLASGALGMAVRAFTVGTTPSGTSGRTTRDGQAAESLNTTGMYSVVRHPLYLGNYFMWIGVALVPGTWWLPLLVSLAFWVYYERIMFAEEHFLRSRFEDEFREWARRTPAFIPRLRNWRPSALPFSMRTALKGEHTGLLGFMAAVFVVEYAGDLTTLGPVAPESYWYVLGPATLVAYLALLLLKKKTRLLHLDGR